MSAKAQSLPARLEALKKIHRNQSAQLDLALETTIRDSKYSAALMDMMRREDTLKDPTTPAAKQLSQKIDDALGGETKAFFAKVALANSKKWDLLSEKLRREREQLKNDLMARVFSIDPAGIAMRIDSNIHDANPHFAGKDHKTENHTTTRTVTAEDIEKESERLQVDYYNNWFRYETHHLQEAFQSQLNRLDVEWKTHEENLQDDYETKKATITGRHAATVHHTANQEEGKRWHSAEKQKTLIHTAPVFTPHLPAQPASGSSRPPSGVKRKETTNATMLAELEKVEREYQVQLQALQAQKSDARRWLHRQQLRLVAQCEAVQSEKQRMGKVLHEQVQELHYMEELLNKVAASTTATATGRT